MADDSGYWQRLTTRRLARRSLIQAGGLTGAAALLAACGGSNNSTSNNAAATAASAAATRAGTPAAAGSGSTPGATAAGSPRAGVAAAIPTPGKLGGVLREADNTQTPHYSPFHPGADPSYINTWRRSYGYYDHLWNFKTFATSTDPKDLLALELPSGIEQPDDSTYVVKLQPSKFHNRPPANGRDVTAEDIVQTFQFLAKPPASGGTFLQSGKDLKSVEAVDPLTLKFTTFGPRAFFYESTAAGVVQIVPKEMLDEQTLKQMPPVGSGPYQYKGGVVASSEDMVKFENYRVKGQPFIAERTFTFLPDVAAEEAAFRAGQHDTFGFSDLNQRNSVIKDLGNKVFARDYPSTSGMALMVNIHRQPWQDPRVREAVYRAIDLDRINNTVFFGDATPTWFFSLARPNRFPLKHDDVKQYVGYDPQKAAQLVKAAGIDPNKDLEIMAPVEAQTWVDSAKLMSEDLAKAGIKTHVTPVIRNLYLQRGGTKPGDFDITMSVLLDYQYAQTQSGTFWNMTSLEDPEIDAIVDKILQTVDLPGQAKLSQQFQTLLAQKYDCFMPLLTSNAHEGYYSYVKGIDPGYSRGVAQQYLWLDK